MIDLKTSDKNSSPGASLSETSRQFVLLGQAMPTTLMQPLHSLIQKPCGHAPKKFLGRLSPTNIERMDTNMSQTNDSPILVVGNILYARELQKILPHMRVISIRSSLTGYCTNLLLIDDEIDLHQTPEQEQNVLKQLQTRLGYKGAMMRVDVDSLVTYDA